MTQKDLAKALLRGQQPVDVQVLTDRILRRDRRRIWFLGILCVIAWMAVVMLPWGFVLPMVQKLGLHLLVGPPTTAPVTHQQSLAIYHVLQIGTEITFFSSIAAMLIAAICTVSLIILSRRATLRQVNARLADIAAQLKQPEKP